MNTTLAVVVSAIVILITALVVITIFSGSIQSFSTITDARSTCEINYRTSCLAFGQNPATWEIPNMNVNGQKIACSSVASCSCTTVSGKYTATCTGATAT